MTTSAERDLLATSDQLPDIFRGRYEVMRRLPGGVHGPSWQVREAESGAPLVLRHRLGLNYRVLTDNLDPEAILSSLISAVPAP